MFPLLRMPVAAIICCLLLAGCSTPEEKLTSTEWLRENSSVLRDLESFEKSRQQQAVVRLKGLGPDRGAAVIVALLREARVGYRGEVLLARILADWRDPRGISYLLKYLRHQDQGAVEIAAQGLVAFEGNREVALALLEMLKSSTKTERFAAARVLEEIGSAELLDGFLGFYTGESEKEVRGLLVKVLLQSKHPNRDEFLVEALMDSDQAIREMAWEGLRKRPGTPKVNYDPAAGAESRTEAVKSLRSWAARGR
mgnify:CR=1 FL=1